MGINIFFGFTSVHLSYPVLYATLKKKRQPYDCLFFFNRQRSLRSLPRSEAYNRFPLFAVPFQTCPSDTKKASYFVTCFLLKPATTYFPRQLPTKYHRRLRA